MRDRDLEGCCSARTRRRQAPAPAGTAQEGLSWMCAVQQPRLLCAVQAAASVQARSTEGPSASTGTQGSRGAALLRR